MEVGLRVVRGPDWDLDDSESECDGGEGFVGTVVEVGGKSSRLPENLVWVQWDSGVHKDHRAGYHKAFDLCVLDSSTTGIEHSDTKCQSCDQTPILGIRWECVDCTPIYNLCTACYMADEHEKSHNFKRIDSQGQEGIPVGKRSGTQKIQASGIFPGAKVMRGPDWELGAEDGGKGREGVVLKITNWKHVPKAGVVVSWDHGDKSTCRLGVDGKVDLKCVSPGAGGFYYKSHLPKLGENHPTGQTKRRHDRHNTHGKSRKNKRPPPAQKKPVKHDKPVQVVKPAVHVMQSESSKTSVCESSQETLGESSMANLSDFKIGESVCVALDVDVVKEMNTNYDMWRDAIVEYIGKKGTLHSISNNGGVNIVYPDRTLWTFNPNLVSKANQHYPDAGAASREPSYAQPQLKCDDYVKILNDEEVVKQLQKSHGPWDDSFCKVLGQTGRILRLNSTGGVEVIVGPRGDENVITFNPAVLSLSSADDKEEDEKHQPDVCVYADLQEINDQSKAAAHLSVAASEGNLPVVEAVLERYPDVIDHLDQGGHTALHSACHQGHFEVVAFLVEKGSNKELKDFQGYTALHHAAYCDRSGQTAYFLVLGGAHIDESQNEYGTTPLHLSIKEYNTETAKVLIQAGCNVNLPELDGFTALALAILHGNVDVVESLLDSPDLFLDLTECPPLYSALTGKDCPGTVKAIIQRFPETASLPLDNGLTPLHFAALYNNVALAEFLLEKGKCDLNLNNKNGLTPIELADMAGSESVMERLLEKTYTNLQTNHQQKPTIATDPSLVAAIRSDLFSMVSPRISRRKTFYRDFKFGDKVQVLGNRALIEAYQTGNGGWVDAMETVLSKFGHVEEVLDNGNIRVCIQDPTAPVSLIFNPLCLDPVEEDQQDSDSRLENYYASDNYSLSAEGTLGDEVSDPLMRDFPVNRRLEGLIASVDSSELYRSRDPELYRGLMYVAVAMGCLAKIKRIIEICEQALFPLESAPPPLHMGCANGDFEVVEVLLEGGADVNLREEPSGFAPLHYAAVGDRTGKVTDMLLRGGADVNDNINTFVATPLHFAVAYGNDAAASKIIQSVGYDFSLKDSQGDTPLSRAVYSGREIIVDLLLAIGKCDHNSYNEQGFNVLHVVAMEGNEKVANTVLSCGSCTSINSPTRDGNSMTPLHLACWKGHAAVARLLLEKGCNFHLPNVNGHIPLEVASKERNHAVVSVLIEWHEGVKEEGHGKPIDDFPPVFCAGDVVKIRSNREVVTILQQGMSDCNIVELLGKEGSVLTVGDQGNVELAIQGYDRTWTFSPWAVECIRHSNPSSSVTRYQLEGQRPRSSLTDAVQKIMENNNTGEPQRQSELIKAVCTSHLSRIKSTILKNPEAVKQKLRGTTLLHLAARNGAIHIMEELLDHKADVNAQDIRQRTPLHVAASKDRTGSAASLLLERRADPNVQGFDDYKRTPLHLAVCRNNYAAAKVLVEHEDCNVNLQDSHGDSPLHCAIDQEKEKLFELIVKSRDCNPRLPNKNPMGPHYNALHLAAVRRNVSVARMVHEVCPEIVEDVDFQGNTALHLAAMHGSKEVADYLLQKGSCNTGLKNKKGKTAFQLATSNGHLEVQKLFSEYDDEYHPPEGELSPVTQKSSSHSLDYRDNEGIYPESALSYGDLDGNYGCVSQAHFASCHPYAENAKIIERTAEAKGKIRVPEKTVKQISISGASADDHGTDKQNQSLQQDRKAVSEEKNQTFCAQVSVSELDLEKTDSKGRYVELLSQETCPHSNSETGVCAKCQEAKAQGNHLEKFTKQEENDKTVIMTEKSKHFAREEEMHLTQDLPHPILAAENSGNTFVKEQKSLSTWQATGTDIPTPPMCVKCHNNRASVTFRPCGHKVTCEGCSFRAKECVKCCSSVAEKVAESAEERHSTSDLPRSTLTADNERHTLDRKQIEPSARQLTTDLPTPPMCVKCDTRRASVIFQPCGHKVTCEECSFSVKKCILCSYPVAEKVSEH